MIGRDELAESARYSDAMSEEHGFEGWAKHQGIEVDGLHYVAAQRALRAAMLMDGQDPSLLSRTEKTRINLSPHVEVLLPSLTALTMDSLVIGIQTGRQDA